MLAGAFTFCPKLQNAERIRRQRELLDEHEDPDESYDDFPMQDDADLFTAGTEAHTSPEGSVAEEVPWDKLSAGGSNNNGAYGMKGEVPSQVRRSAAGVVCCRCSMLTWWVFPGCVNACYVCGCTRCTLRRISNLKAIYWNPRASHQPFRVR